MEHDRTMMVPFPSSILSVKPVVYVSMTLDRSQQHLRSLSDLSFGKQVTLFYKSWCGMSNNYIYIYIGNKVHFYIQGAPWDFAPGALW